MNNINSKNVPSALVFLVFLVSLFVFFTPFEQSGPSHSMLPKYLVAGIAIALLVPLSAISTIAFRPASVLVLIVLATLIFHTTVINPVPGQFVLLIAANFFLAILTYEASFKWRKQFVSAICALLLLQAAVIAVQALLFYAMHTMIDFHKILFGSESRFVEDYLNIARFAGLQVEPGTYANYVACLMAILLLSAEFNARIFWISFISLISIFLTNSGSSVYFVPLMLVLLLYLGRKRVKPWHVAGLALALVAYVYFSGILPHLESRFFEHQDGSLSHRMEGVEAYMTTSWEEKMAGVGFGSDPCVRCYYQDIGVTFNLLTRGGIILALALALLVMRALSVNGVLLTVILFLVPLNEKMFFYEAPIWLFILFGMTALKQSRQVPGPDAARRAHAPNPERA